MRQQTLFLHLFLPCFHYFPLNRFRQRSVDFDVRDKCKRRQCFIHYFNHPITENAPSSSTKPEELDHYNDTLLRLYWLSIWLADWLAGLLAGWLAGWLIDKERSLTFVAVQCVCCSIVVVLYLLCFRLFSFVIRISFLYINFGQQYNTCNSYIVFFYEDWIYLI